MSHKVEATLQLGNWPLLKNLDILITAIPTLEKCICFPIKSAIRLLLVW
jgi:hypothetical protein